MPIYVDPTDPRQNCYVTLEVANRHLARRIYTEEWDGASSSPSGYGFTVNDPGSSLVVGSTSISITGGSGSLEESEITFYGYPTIYNVTAQVGSTLTISPGLVAVPDHGLEIERVTPNTKEKVLLWATKVFDDQIEWFGFPRWAPRDSLHTMGPFQNLDWPRSGVVTRAGFAYPYETIPIILQEATAELALYLLQRDLSRTPDLLGLGLKQATMPGPVQVVIDKAMVTPMIPDYILSKISDLGELRGGGTGARQVRLQRV